MPAEAGIQTEIVLDPRFRGGDITFVKFTKISIRLHLPKGV